MLVRTFSGNVRSRSRVVDLESSGLNLLGTSFPRGIWYSVSIQGDARKDYGTFWAEFRTGHGSCNYGETAPKVLRVASVTGLLTRCTSHCIHCAWLVRIGDDERSSAFCVHGQ